MKSDLTSLLHNFNKKCVLVVGDLILDRFIWGRVDRISPEAPVPVVRVTHESHHPGGAANVVNNIQTLGGSAIPVGFIGEDESGTQLSADLEESGISLAGVVSRADCQTTQKTRILASQQQVVRIDREDHYKYCEQSMAQIKGRIATLLPNCQAVIISDYGKGVVTSELLKWLATSFTSVPVLVDPKDRNFEYYHDVDLITPNKAEAERISGIPIEKKQDLPRAAEVIFSRLNCKNLLITLGEQGMALFEGPGEPKVIPTLAREVFDVSGAGDTVIATFSLAIATGANPYQAAVLANAAAGVVVGKLGTATLTREELQRSLSLLGQVPGPL